MSSEYYVYQYTDEYGVPYYVGKGKNNRMHVAHKHTILPPHERRVVVQKGLSNDEAKLLEVSLIQTYKRKIDGGTLDNIKINQWACRAGWLHSEETKQKISNSNRGKKRSASAIANYAKPKTAEHAQKIREANLGRKDSVMRREANKQAQLNPEVKQIKSQKMKDLIAQRKAQGLTWGEYLELEKTF